MSVLGFIKEALSGDTGASSRRLGYILSTVTLCTALLFLCGSIGYVIAVVPLAKASVVLPQLCSTFEMISGIVAASVTTGYILKQKDVSSAQ